MTERDGAAVTVSWMVTVYGAFGEPPLAHPAISMAAAAAKSPTRIMQFPPLGLVVGTLTQTTDNELSLARMPETDAVP